MKTKTEMKQKAQDELLAWALNAFTAASDQNQPEYVIDEMRKQFQRIEKLFGYVPGSHKV